MRRSVTFGMAAVVIIAGLVFSYRSDGDLSTPIAVSDTVRVEQFEPSVISYNDTANFKKHHMSFYFPSNMEEYWEFYLKMEPNNLWSGPINNLVMIKGFTDGYKTKIIDEGSIVLLELHIFKNKTTPVLFDVSEINSVNKTIKMRYAKDNVSQGYQEIKFYKSGDGVELHHNTYYKSNSSIRDVFYPIYHEKCVREFHTNIHSRYLESKMSDTTIVI